MNREAIYSALYNQLSGSVTATMSGRGPKHFKNIPQGAQPAFFVNQLSEQVESELGRPQKWRLKVEVILYAYDSGAGTVAQINGMVDQVQAALQAKPGEKSPSTTLGGLVSHAWITQVQSFTPIENLQQGIAIVNVEMLTTG
jgi:hypothetical protein